MSQQYCHVCGELMDADGDYDEGVCSVCRDPVPEPADQELNEVEM